MDIVLMVLAVLNLCFLLWLLYLAIGMRSRAVDIMQKLNEIALRILETRSLVEVIYMGTPDAPANDYAKRQRQRALEAENLLYGAKNKLGVEEKDES